LTVQGPAGTRELPYDALLLGAGRKPNVEQLGLEAASVRFRRDGAEVDEYLRTSNPDIYAAGDVAFPHKFTHAAMATARLCVANALDGAGRRARELVIPHCTYTDPEVAQVGLTPRQAQEEGIAIDEYRLELTKVERAFIDGEEEGFAAIYTRRGSGEIVGATLVSAHAGEMISELTLAMTHKVPLEVLAETVHCCPTQAEFFQRVALQYASGRSAHLQDHFHSVVAFRCTKAVTLNLSSTALFGWAGRVHNMFYSGVDRSQPAPLALGPLPAAMLGAGSA
jgi:pyruvate/2-oxoglutarate dehydrogenase complex dihydrolipoamide dehydrogenase (E3) component